MGTSVQCPLLPKDASAGSRPLTLGGKLYIERDDAVDMKVNEEITLMHWGNAIIREIETSADGKVVSMKGELNLAGDYTTTKKKVTFIADAPEMGKVKLVELDHLIVKAKLAEEDAFENFVTPQSWFETEAVCDTVLRKNVSKGQFIQIERRGYFICDSNPEDLSQPMVLIFVPDGKQGAMSNLKPKVELKLK